MISISQTRPWRKPAKPVSVNESQPPTTSGELITHRAEQASLHVSPRCRLQSFRVVIAGNTQSTLVESTYLPSSRLTMLSWQLGVSESESTYLITVMYHPSTVPQVRVLSHWHFRSATQSPGPFNPTISTLNSRHHLRIHTRAPTSSSTCKMPSQLTTIFPPWQKSTQ